MTGRQRLSRRRKAVGHTQESLAALLGVERSTAARWEQGRSEPMAWQRPRLAAALNVTVEELADLLVVGVDHQDGRSQRVPLEAQTSVGRRAEPANHDLTAVVRQVRRAMWDSSFNRLPAGDGTTLDMLDRRVTAAWRSWHSSDRQRGVVGRVLPDLIHEVHLALDTDDTAARRRAQALLGDVYRLVQRFLAHISEPELHVLAVERGRSYSEAADRPYSLALAAWSSAISASASGHFEDAARVAASGARMLEPSLELIDADVLGAYGALHLESAAAHGFAGRIDVADRHLATASRVAERLPAGYWHPSPVSSGAV